MLFVQILTSTILNAPISSHSRPLLFSYLVPPTLGFFLLAIFKASVATYVSLCDVCQRVKAEHQRLASLLQPLKVPEWKWKQIGMDFIVGLPRTREGYDSIWVIVDRLTKVAHFIPVKITYSGA